MKINRSKLLQQIEELIDKRTKRLNKLNQAERDRVAEEERAYMVKTHAAWEMFAHNILQALRREETITIDTVPEPLRGNLDYIYFRAKMPRVRGYSDETIVPLTSLRDLLQASRDEDVSTYALEKQGYRLAKLLGPSVRF